MSKFMAGEDVDSSSRGYVVVEDVDSSRGHVAEEVKELWKMALPIAASQMMAFLRQSVSIMFLGRLGSLELAGGALSVGFTNITGYSVLMGLASGLEPVCSQAHGSKNLELMCGSLRKMIFILFMASVPITLLWANMAPIMSFIGQEPSITSMAGTFCLYSLPDIVTHMLLQPLRVFLRSQEITKPIMYCSLLATLFHVPLNYFLVEAMEMGIKGVAMASVVTNFNTLVLMVGYVWWAAPARGWEIMKWEAPTKGDEIWPLLRVAVPSCIGICLEWWWYEIVLVMAGYLKDPTRTVAATGIVIQTTSIMYTVPMALAASVSTRVGNELGGGRPKRARMAAVVAVACSFIIGAANVTWTVMLRRHWAAFFTKDINVTDLVVSVLPIIGLCEMGNCPQTTGCGILRGTAQPVVGARINLTAFYLVGTPVAVGLAFWGGMGFNGLWLGLLSAQVVCLFSILYMVLWRMDWEREAAKAKKLTAVELEENQSLMRM